MEGVLGFGDWSFGTWVLSLEVWVVGFGAVGQELGDLGFGAQCSGIQTLNPKPYAGIPDNLLQFKKLRDAIGA